MDAKVIQQGSFEILAAGGSPDLGASLENQGNHATFPSHDERLLLFRTSSCSDLVGDEWRRNGLIRNACLNSLGDSKFKQKFLLVLPDGSFQQCAD
jgi:hypothetical protein